eukprot:TRINITY_DN2189_c0_g1_i1.p2 TRINITY_DN2189_c0_g1~~TRINITY_DN2189_c0_g1_i1.p2  ORF type:complete len:113 (+),score=16.52 TRINITY_DN2189_c0_g1_i1:158-496(+)
MMISCQVNGFSRAPQYRQLKSSNQRGNIFVVQSRLPTQITERIEDPVVKQFVKEPVAFFGGVFAGVLGLNLQEDPLRSWIESTAAAAGVSYEVANRKVQQQLNNMKQRSSNR